VLCVQLLTLASELFTDDHCLVVLSAFCRVNDDDSQSDFNVCLTWMTEKVRNLVTVKMKREN